MTDEQRRKVEDNYNLIYTVLKRFPGAHKQWDDYVQAASEGLCKAVISFNPEYGFAFSTYAFPVIYGSICKHYRDFECKLVNIPRSMIDKREFPGIMRLDAPLPSREETQDKTWSDILEPLVDKKLTDELTIFKLSLEQIKNSMDDRTKLLYDLRFNFGLTQAQTAKKMELSQSQISRIETKIKEKFHAALAV